MMFPWTKRTLDSLSQPMRSRDEGIEVMLHLLAGSARWRLRHFPALTNPWEASGNTEYAVLTDRQLLILASDPGTGRPARPLLFATSRVGLGVIEVGGRSVRAIDLQDGEGTRFRLYVPPTARREGVRLTEALGSPTR